MTAGLPLTGERTVPGVASENYWFRRHEAAYEFAATLVAGRVLEVGCGEGYGTAMLVPHAEAVLGVDYDATTVQHAVRAHPTAAFVRANLAALPIRDGAVDTLVTLQVIEHVWDHPGFVAECRRVLRPGGRMLVTTPNRLTFSPGAGPRDRPLNPFHSHEFTAAELTGLLAAGGFEVDTVAGLQPGSRLRDLDRSYGGSFVGAQLADDPSGWAATLRRDVESVTTADFTIGADADASLDLVVVAVRSHGGL